MRRCCSFRTLDKAKHLLTDQSNLHYWLGCAFIALGDETRAQKHWNIAADSRGDFQQMSIRAFSEMTYYSALSMRRLGRTADAEKLLTDLLEYAQQLEMQEAKIDYFATSLPTMLLFDDDLQKRQTIAAKLMQAQAHLGLGNTDRGQQLLREVLKLEPSHLLASQLVESASTENETRHVTRASRP